MAQGSAPELIPARHRTATLTALAGSAALFVGVFLPIVRFPIVGSINYFSNGRGDGAIVLVLAAVSAALAVKGAHRWLMATGLPSLMLTVVTFLRLRFHIAGMNSSLQSGLEGNPFAGLAAAFAQSVQLEFGWAVLALGPVLLMIAAVNGRSSTPVAEASGADTTTWGGFGRPAIVTTAIVSIVMILLGTTDLVPRAAAASAPLAGPTFAQTTAPVEPQVPEYDFSKILEVESVSGRVVHKNIEAGRFSDAVVIEPRLRNTSGKTIVGIRGTVFLLDGFGRDVDSFNFKDADKLATGSHTAGGDPV